MLRSGASRLALRPYVSTPVRPASYVFQRAAPQLQTTAQFKSVAHKRPRALLPSQWKPIQTAVIRRSMADKINREAEDRYLHEKIEPHPERVTTTSTIHPIFSEVGAKDAERDVDMMSGVKHDINTVRETFSMDDVPRQAYILGLAGVLPYLATSLSTVFCAYEINHAAEAGAYFLSAHTAESLLHVLEPLQIGYGAVILSFLGAIHWGLEWAGYGGYQGYRRYAIGVVAPAVAWPTVLMPIEYALITQFTAFIMLYYADTRATYQGWTPAWYAIYRFVLTFIVGASIVVSLIGRGEVSDKIGRLPGAVDRITALRESTQHKLAEAEQAELLRKESEQSSGDGEESE